MQGNPEEHFSRSLRRREHTSIVQVRYGLRLAGEMARHGSDIEVGVPTGPASENPPLGFWVHEVDRTTKGGGVCIDREDHVWAGGRENHEGRPRKLAAIAIAGLVLMPLILIAFHFIQPELNPLKRFGANTLLGASAGS